MTANSADAQRLWGYVGGDGGDVPGNFLTRQAPNDAGPIVYGDFLFSFASGGTDATINGATLAETQTLIVGSLTGQANATFSGVTVAESHSLVVGSLSGASSGTIAGATLQETHSLLVGGLSGQVNRTISGQTLAEGHSLAAGGLSAGVSATMAGATISESWAVISGLLTGEIAQPQEIGIIDGLKRKPDERQKKLEELIEAAFERVTAPGDVPTQQDVKAVVRSVRQEIKLDGIEAAISEIRNIVNQYAAYLKKRADDEEEEILAFMMMG